MIKLFRVAIMLFAFCSGVLAIEPEQPSLKEAVSVASEGKCSSFANNAASMIGLLALPIAFLIGNKLTSKKIIMEFYDEKIIICFKTNLNHENLKNEIIPKIDQKYTNSNYKFYFCFKTNETENWKLLEESEVLPDDVQVVRAFLGFKPDACDYFIIAKRFNDIDQIQNVDGEQNEELFDLLTEIDRHAKAESDERQIALEVSANEQNLEKERLREVKRSNMEKLRDLLSRFDYVIQKISDIPSLNEHINALEQARINLNASILSSDEKISDVIETQFRNLLSILTRVLYTLEPNHTAQELSLNPREIINLIARAKKVATNLTQFRRGCFQARDMLKVVACPYYTIGKKKIRDYWLNEEIRKDEVTSSLQLFREMQKHLLRTYFYDYKNELIEYFEGIFASVETYEEEKSKAFKEYIRKRGTEVRKCKKRCDKLESCKSFVERSRKLLDSANDPRERREITEILGKCHSYISKCSRNIFNQQDIDFNAKCLGISAEIEERFFELLESGGLPTQEIHEWQQVVDDLNVRYCNFLKGCTQRDKLTEEFFIDLNERIRNFFKGSSQRDNLTDEFLIHLNKRISNFSKEFSERDYILEESLNNLNLIIRHFSKWSSQKANLTEEFLDYLNERIRNFFNGSRKSLSQREEFFDDLKIRIRNFFEGHIRRDNPIQILLDNFHEKITNYSKLNSQQVNLTEEFFADFNETIRVLFKGSSQRDNLTEEFLVDLNERIRNFSKGFCMRQNVPEELTNGLKKVAPSLLHYVGYPISFTETVIDLSQNKSFWCAEFKSQDQYSTFISLWSEQSKNSFFQRISYKGLPIHYSYGLVILDCVKVPVPGQIQFKTLWPKLKYYRKLFLTILEGSELYEFLLGLWKNKSSLT